MSSPSSSLAISWVLSTVSGYGIYGLHIALQFLRRGGNQLILPRKPAVPSLPPLVEGRMRPYFDLAGKLHEYLKEKPEELLSFNHPVLHAVGNDFSGFYGQDKIWGKPNVGCAAIEHIYATEHGRKISKNYDMFIAISRWNAEFLQSLNLHGPVHLYHQGIDGTLFYPGPRTGLYKDRFVIFSGGKFEFRKGQDIVLAAFKIFHARHPEALLVTCWQNLLMPDAKAFEQVGHCKQMPAAAPDFGLQLTPWLLAQGLPPGSFVDLPFTHNLIMPTVYHECDVAIFPNRCEGGTNLVAMEAMACGVPTYVSYNTGQKDLVDLIGCGAFRTQKPVAPSPVMATTADWGESDVEEVVEKLEYVYSHRAEAARDALTVAEKMKQWEWSPLNEKLLSIVYDEGMKAGAA